MNALDIAITVILAYFLLRGIFRGLVKELVGILGLFIAFWVASSYWELGAEQLSSLTEKEAYRGVLSFVIIYLVVYFLVGLISIFVDKIVKITISPVVSSVFGGMLGLLKGAALSLILLTAVTAFLFTSDSFFEKSKAWQHAGGIAAEIKSFFPQKLGGFIEERQSEARGSLAEDRPEDNLGLAPPRDYPSLMAVKEKYGDRISSALMGRLESLTPESLDPALLTSFIRENPRLFSAPIRNAPWPDPETPEE